MNRIFTWTLRLGGILIVTLGAILGIYLMLSVITGRYGT